MLANLILKVKIYFHHYVTFHLITFLCYSLLSFSENSKMSAKVINKSCSEIRLPVCFLWPIRKGAPCKLISLSWIPKAIINFYLLLPAKSQSDSKHGETKRKKPPDLFTENKSNVVKYHFKTHIYTLFIFELL